MLLTRDKRAVEFLLLALALFSAACRCGHAEAALLMEEPFGFFRSALGPRSLECRKLVG